MLAEYALVPDIFDNASYSSTALCDVYLSQLKGVLLEEALVRDLRGGEWSGYFKQGIDRWHQRAKELHKKLVQQKRLRSVPPARQQNAVTDGDWCIEAIASHAAEPLNGIIAANVLAAQFRQQPAVVSIERLPSALWWQQRSPSVRLARTIDSYLECLRLVLGHANSLMFIDPHLDPDKQGYSGFGALLAAAARPVSQPLIEIHRVCYEGSGPGRRIVPNTEWCERFRDGLGPALARVRVSVEVFIWNDFHDRYLITDLIGISVPNGFDVGDQLTTWTRLGRSDRDDIQREFDPAVQMAAPNATAARRHMLHHRFRIEA
jgi:hypothetical protein